MFDIHVKHVGKNRHFLGNRQIYGGDYCLFFLSLWLLARDFTCRCSSGNRTEKAEFKFKQYIFELCACQIMNIQKKQSNFYES